MDITHIKISKANLAAYPIVDGQIFAIKDADDMYYDLGGVRHHVSDVEVVSTLPSEGANNKLYYNESDNQIYVCLDGFAFTKVGGDEFTYYCNGVDDNLKISAIVNGWVASVTTVRSFKLSIKGKLGFNGNGFTFSGTKDCDVILDFSCTNWGTTPAQTFTSALFSISGSTRYTLDSIVGTFKPNFLIGSGGLVNVSITNSRLSATNPETSANAFISGVLHLNLTNVTYVPDTNMSYMFIEGVSGSSGNVVMNNCTVLNYSASCQLIACIYLRITNCRIHPAGTPSPATSGRVIFALYAVIDACDFQTSPISSTATSAITWVLGGTGGTLSISNTRMAFSNTGNSVKHICIHPNGAKAISITNNQFSGVAPAVGIIVPDEATWDTSNIRGNVFSGTLTPIQITSPTPRDVKIQFDNTKI